MPPRSPRPPRPSPTARPARPARVRPGARAGSAAPRATKPPSPVAPSLAAPSLPAPSRAAPSPAAPPPVAPSPAAAAPPTSAHRERSLATRARLVEAAIDRLSELGYVGATTPLIARSAGVTRGALQHHFASRVDLDIAVIDHVATALNFRLDAEALARRTLPERVAALVDAYWRAFDGPLFRAALHIWLAVLRDPPVAARLGAHLAGLQARIESTWRTLFADTGLGAHELATLRHVVMGAARGWAVEQLFNPTGGGRPERAMLQRMVLGEFERARAPR